MPEKVRINSSRRILEHAAGGLILLLAFLLPLKFGTIAVIPEATSFFPGGWFEYLIISWPASAFGIASGIALLAALTAFPHGVARWRDAGWRTMVLWSFAIPVFALIGFVNASSFDFAILQWSHFLGIAAWFAAAYLYVSSGRGRLLLTALALGSLLLTWYGLEQYFWGFKESQEFVLAQEAKGIAIHNDLKARAFDTRVFATFTSCNSLAGYLLLMFLPVAALLWQWGSRVEPVRWSRPLFALLGGGAMFAVLLLTKSRAAYLTLAVAAGLAALLWPMRRRWKIALIVLAVVTVLGGAFYIHAHGRGFESMEARVDYIRSSLLLLREHPLLGCGWGEFFFGHMRLKIIDSKEAAHDPHNILLMAAQGGSFLLIVMSLALSYPLVMLGKKLIRLRRNGEPVQLIACLIAGGGMLLIHSMMDVNSQIPAIMAALGVIYLIGLTGEGASASDASPRSLRIVLLIALMLLGIGSFGVSLRMLQGEMAFDRLLSLSMARGKTPDEIRRGRPEQVRNALDGVIAIRPYSSFAYSVAADYYIGRDMLEDAEALLDNAIKLAPRRAALYQRKSLIALRRGDLAAAQRELRRAQKLFPRNQEYQLPESE